MDIAAVGGLDKEMLSCDLDTHILNGKNYFL